MPISDSAAATRAFRGFTPIIVAAPLRTVGAAS
jgi:hypothetical protein